MANHWTDRYLDSSKAGAEPEPKQETEETEEKQEDTDDESE